MGSGGSSSGLAAKSKKQSADTSTIVVKDWFISQKADEVLRRPFETFLPGAAEAKILKESEKAYFVAMDYTTIDGERDGVKRFWVPKSVTMTKMEYDAAKKSRFEEYDRVLNFAKSKGIKGVRSGMKKSTLLNKIRAAGFEYKP